jgi:hypothetical protein
MEAKKYMIDNKNRGKITPDQEAKILDAIKKYCKSGLYILPVRPVVKIPHTEHGFKDSTSNFDTFMKSYHPGDNIGIETGKKNNVYIWDFDVLKDKNGKPVLEDGKQVQLGFKAFCKKFHIKDSNDPRLKTRMVRTQSGGLHIYYKLPPGKEPLARSIGIMPHVDLLGERGFAVIPPSVGQYGTYEVVIDVSFKDLLEMPDEFYDLIGAKNKREVSTEQTGLESGPMFKPDQGDKVLLVDTISQIFNVKTGRGNHLTIFLAGAMAKRGYSEPETLEIFNKAAAKNGWNSNEWVGPVKATFKKFRDSPEDTGGLSLLFQELEKSKDSYGVKYDAIVNNLQNLLIREYKIILKQGLEWGIIKDSVPGREGTITYWRKKQKFDKKTGTPVMNDAGQFVFEDIPTELVEYNGSIYVCKLEDEKVGLTFTFDGEEARNFPIDDAIIYIVQHYGVAPRNKQRLISILRGFALQYSNNAPYIPLSPVSVKDGKIDIMFDTSKISVEGTLTQLHNFLINLASNPEGFLATFSWSLLAPFHYYVKTLSELTVYVPNLVLSGKTKGGKTSLTDTFNLKGYDVLNKDDKGNFQYHLQDITTTFTLMNSLRASNLPAIFDEIGMQFFNYHKESIKGYASSIRFGQRGTASQNTNKYTGIRSFVATMNDPFDLSSDLALSGRLIVIPFDEQNTRRQHRDQFIKFYNSLPNGFMFAILKHLFQGKPINELVSELQQCDTPDKWVSVGIKFINQLCQQLEIPQFPEYESVKTKSETMAYQIAASFASEYERGLNSEFHNSRIWGEVQVENKGKGKESRKFIYFTGGAFKTIIRNYNNHFNTAAEYMNNIPKDDDVRVEYEGKNITKRIGNDVKHVYIVSIPNWDEDTGVLDNDKGDSPIDPGNGNNSSVFNAEYENIPDGPVKDEIIQDKEDIANEEAKLQERNKGPAPVETLPDTANYDINKDFIEKIRETLANEKFILDGNTGPSFDKKDFQLYVHPTELSMDRFTSLKAIMKGFGFKYSSIQDPYGVRFIRKIGGWQQ